MNSNLDRLTTDSKKIGFSIVYWGIYWAFVWTSFILILSIITGAWVVYDMAEPAVVYAILGGVFGLIGGMTVGRKTRGKIKSAINWAIVFAIPGTGLAIWTSMPLMAVALVVIGAAGGFLGEYIYYRIRPMKLYQQLMIVILVAALPLLLVLHSPYYQEYRHSYAIWNAQVVENPEIIAHQKPDLIVDTDIFKQAGCHFDTGSKSCDVKAGPLAKFRCLGISAPDPLLGGLDPAYPIADCSGIGSSWLARPCLYETGCMVQVGVGYVVFRDNEFHLVSSERELRNLYAPIDSPEEALSYALAATGYFALYDTEISNKYEYLVDRIENTHVIETWDGYLVNLFDYPACGCGQHGTFTTDIYVRRSGQIEKLNQELVYRDISKICYD